MIKYLSLFSGIGGFEYGIQLSRHRDKLINIGYSEIDKYADSIYRKRFPSRMVGDIHTHTPMGDVTKLRTSDLPSFDLLVGGFPCQAFSIAGKRRGFDDTRGTLFFEIARILADKRPKYFLLENVRGLLSHKKGETFQTILEVLSDLGYNVQWTVYNSKDYGVPQNRERIFIKGYSGADSGQKVLHFGGINKAVVEPMNYKINKIGHVRKGQGGATYSTEGISPCLCSGDLSHNGGINILEPKINIIGNVSTTGYNDDDVLSVDGITKTLTATGHQPKIIKPVLTPDRENKRQNGRRMKEDGEPMFTLTATDKHGVCDGYTIRKLTPVECERLQGFPDNWTKYGKDNEPISDTQRYKCCGNAVTTNVITAIINEMFKEVIEDEND